MFSAGHSRNQGGSFSPSKIQYSVFDEGAVFSGFCKLILLLRQTLLPMPRMIIVWPKEWAGSAMVDFFLILEDLVSQVRGTTG